jgi:hypothetical protein
VCRSGHRQEKFSTYKITEYERYCVVRYGVTDIGEATANSIFRAVDVKAV